MDECVNHNRHGHVSSGDKSSEAMISLERVKINAFRAKRASVSSEARISLPSAASIIDFRAERDGAAGRNLRRAERALVSLERSETRDY